MAPFADTDNPFAASQHYAYRFLVVRTAADSCTGRIVELIAQQSIEPEKSAQLALAGTRPLLAGQAPGSVQDFTGALLAYSPAYEYETGFAYKAGVLQPLRMAPGISSPDTCYDYYLVGYDNTGVQVIHDFLYTSCTGGIPGTGGGWGGGGGSGTTGGGGGGGNSMTVIVNTGGTKSDPKKENRCFTASQGAILTVYVEQARTGTRNPVGPNQVGHTFVGIQQNGITRYLGYYPPPSASSTGLLVGVNYPSEIHENSGHNYDVSVTAPITGGQLGAIISYINNYPTTYNLNTYNCADFGIAVGNLGGMNLPVTTSSGYFSGRSPGNLGEDIRGMTPPSGGSINTNGGNAPTKQGTCP